MLLGGQVFWANGVDSALRHSRKGGNLACGAGFSPSRSNLGSRLRVQIWVPAFAGMTEGER